jgi:hypothetical protein
MRHVTLCLLLILSAGCGMFGGGAPAKPAQPVQPRSAAFENRLWQVAAGSDIPAGALYVFLSDNTLLITSGTGTPAIGRWLLSGDGLVMIEEGMQYQTEIVELGPARFVVRQRNPGGVVNIVFVPAVSRR